jgi:competence protein ComEA
MADDLPSAGVAAPAGPPAEAPPPVWTPAGVWALAALSALALALLAWRGWGLSRWSQRPVPIEKGVVALAPLDLNAASAADLENVPGLGPTLAARIVEERDRRGQFKSLDELRQVKGIGPATLERIRSFLYVGTYSSPGPAPALAAPGPAAPTGPGKKPTPAGLIDVNRAREAELRTLPGIGPTLAARIIEARRKQPFRSVEDLRKVRGIGAKTLARLRPHVTTGPAGPDR